MGDGPKLFTNTTSNLPDANKEVQTNALSSNGDYESTTPNSPIPTESMDPMFPPIIDASEPSGPPSPTKGPIRNFGEVSVGLYRSSFPGPDNIEHLQSLGLKTLITLVTTPFEPSVENWIANSGIEHYRFDITAHKTPAHKTTAHKTPNERIPMKDVASVMTLLNDETKRPLLVHCNKGKHRTGCMVAAFCKLQGTEEERVVADYHEFAQSKARDLDIAFIRDLKVGAVRNAMGRLEAVNKPVCYDGQCNGLSRDDASTSREGVSEDEDGSIGHRTQKPVDIGRVVVGPKLPPSPPIAAAFKGCSDFSQQLADALCRVQGGRSRDVPTPPETP